MGTFMAKLISLMVRLTVIAGVLLSLQSVVARRLAQARKATDPAAASASDNKCNPLPDKNSGHSGWPVAAGSACRDATWRRPS